MNSEKLQEKRGANIWEKIAELENLNDMFSLLYFLLSGTKHKSRVVSKEEVKEILDAINIMSQYEDEDECADKNTVNDNELQKILDTLKEEGNYSRQLRNYIHAAKPGLFYRKIEEHINTIFHASIDNRDFRVNLEDLFGEAKNNQIITRGIIKLLRKILQQEIQKMNNVNHSLKISRWRTIKDYLKELEAVSQDDKSERRDELLDKITDIYFELLNAQQTNSQQKNNSDKKRISDLKKDLMKKLPDKAFVSNTVKKEAVRYLLSNSHIDLERILRVIKRVHDKSDRLDQLNVKALVGKDKKYRIRISDNDGNELRIVFTKDRAGNRKIISISSREDAYR